MSRGRRAAALVVPLAVAVMFAWGAGRVRARYGGPPVCDFQSLYRVGETLQLVRRMSVVVPGKMDATWTHTLSINVARGETGAEKRLAVAVRRVQVQGVLDGKEVNHDTDSPAGMAKDDPLLLEAKTVLDFTLGPGDLPTGSGWDSKAFRNLLATVGKARADEVLAKRLADNVCHILMLTLTHLPKQAVTVGKTWRFSSDLPKVETWRHGENEGKEHISGKLVKVVPTPLGKVALIQLAGEQRFRKPLPDGSTTLALQGDIQANVDAGLLLRHRVQLRGRALSAVIETTLEKGPPAAGAAGKQ